MRARPSLSHPRLLRGHRRRRHRLLRQLSEIRRAGAHARCCASSARTIASSARRSASPSPCSRCEIDYLTPARLDDLLTVETRVLAVGGAVIRLDQQVRRGGANCWRGFDCASPVVSRLGRPTRLPEPRARRARPMCAFPRSSFSDGPRLSTATPTTPLAIRSAAGQHARAAAGPGSVGGRACSCRPTPSSSS